MTTTTEPEATSAPGNERVLMEGSEALARAAIAARASASEPSIKTRSLVVVVLVAVIARLPRSR